MIVVARRGITAQASVPWSAHNTGKGDISEDRNGDDDGEKKFVPAVLVVAAASLIAVTWALGAENEKDVEVEADIGFAGAAKPAVSLLHVWSQTGGSASSWRMASVTAAGGSAVPLVEVVEVITPAIASRSQRRARPCTSATSLSAAVAVVDAMAAIVAAATAVVELSSRSL